MTAVDQAAHRTNLIGLHEALPDLVPQHLGKFALVIGGKVVNLFETNREALLAARASRQDDQASVMRVDPQPADLGFLDCADYPR